MTIKEHIDNFKEKIRFLFSYDSYKDLENKYLKALNNYSNIINENSQKDKEIIINKELIRKKENELINLKKVNDTINKKLSTLSTELLNMKGLLSKKDFELIEETKLLKEKNNIIKQKDSINDTINKKLSTLSAELLIMKELLSKKDIELIEKTKLLEEKNSIIKQKDIILEEKDSDIIKLKDDRVGISGKLELINNILSEKNGKLLILYDKYDELKDLISVFIRRISVLKGMLFIKDKSMDEDNNKYDEYIKQAIVKYDILLYKIKKRLIISGNRSIVLAGQFNTGKTSLLNKLFNIKLPTKITRATAVPTYISYSKINQIKVENHVHNFFITGEENILKNFEYKSDNDGILWSNIIKRIFYYTNKMHSHGITFIDLPGYSGSEIDYNISINESKAADGVIFLASLGNGDFTSEDIAFLKKLNDSKIPIMIVLSQIDDKPITDVANIEKKMIESLENNKIVYSSFIKYSTEKNLNKDISDIIKSSDRLLNKFLKEIKEKQPEFEELRDKTEETIIEVRNILNSASRASDSCFKLKNYFSKAKSILREINTNFSEFINNGFFGKSFMKDKFNEETKVKIKELNNMYENINKLNANMSDWEKNIYYLAKLITSNIVKKSVDLSYKTGNETKNNHYKTEEFIDDINDIKKLTINLFENNPEKISNEIFLKDIQKILDHQKEIKTKILNKYLEVFINE